MKQSLLIFGMILILIAAGCGRPPRPPRASSVQVEEVSSNPEAVSEEIMPYDILPEDWPCWRGPSQQGIVENASLPTKFSSTEHVKWESKIPGKGHGSPIVTHGMIFLATADESSQKQMVMACDLATGQEKWIKTAFEGNFEEGKNIHPKSSHASSTMVTDGKQVYAAFLNNHGIQVIAYDLEGNELWKETAAPYVSRFGFGTSLIVFGNNVIIPVEHEGGGNIVALDRKTGKIAWRKNRKAYNSYQTPRLYELDGKTHMFLSGNLEFTSFDPVTGNTNYSKDGLTETHIGTLINEGNIFAVSGGFPKQETVGFEVTASGVKELWRNGEKVYIPSMGLYEGHIYAVTDNGVGYCWELKTGTKKWQSRVGGTYTASPVICQSVMYMPNEQGEVKVIKLNPEKYELLETCKLGDEIHASAAVVDNSLLFRVARREATGLQEYLVRISN